mmetsp:Transcript_69877/g.157947  ORF Transcript_69877/g.157947 Transcript_69877/m.157947 type:complete len:309 (-) Transcript_69877:721-1647(-)
MRRTSSLVTPSGNIFLKAVAKKGLTTSSRTASVTASTMRLMKASATLPALPQTVLTSSLDMAPSPSSSKKPRKACRRSSIEGPPGPLNRTRALAISSRRSDSEPSVSRRSKRAPTKLTTPAGLRWDWTDLPVVLTAPLASSRFAFSTNPSVKVLTAMRSNGERTGTAHLMNCALVTHPRPPVGSMAFIVSLPMSASLAFFTSTSRATVGSTRPSSSRLSLSACSMRASSCSSSLAVEKDWSHAASMAYVSPCSSKSIDSYLSAATPLALTKGAMSSSKVRVPLLSSSMWSNRSLICSEMGPPSAVITS